MTDIKKSHETLIENTLLIAHALSICYCNEKKKEIVCKEYTSIQDFVT